MYYINSRTLAGPHLTSDESKFPEAEGWIKFETREEARNALPVSAYAVSRGVYESPVYIPRSEFQDYLRSNHALYRTKAEADSVYESTTPLYGVRTGDGRYISVICEEARARFERDGYKLFDSKEEAEKHLPVQVFVLLKHSGEIRPYEVFADRETGEADLYPLSEFYVAPTRTECVAMVPEVYVWNESEDRYEKRRTNAQSLFSLTREFVKTVRDGTYPNYSTEDAVFRHAKQIYNRMFHTSASVNDLPDFCQKINRITGNEMFFVCYECEDSLCYSPCAQEHPIQEGELICQSCRNHFVDCSDCGSTMRRSDAQRSEEGEWYCEEHLPDPDGDESEGELLEHTARVNSRKAMFLLHPEERKADLWLGWELEVYAKGSRSIAIEDVREAFGDHCIVKRDGSIGDGFEIVSVPATLRWHQEHSRKFLERMAGKLEGWNHANCGIHVHVGIAETSALQRARVVSFISDSANEKFVTHMAGRGSGDYTRRLKKRLSAFQDQASEGRYAAVNFETHNEATMEFRIFRSNVAPLGFLKNLEFTHALTTWCKYAGNREVANRQLGVVGTNAVEPHKAFVAWVGANRAQYRNLNRWLQENGYASGLRDIPVSIAA